MITSAPARGKLTLNEHRGFVARIILAALPCPLKEEGVEGLHPCLYIFFFAFLFVEIFSSFPRHAPKRNLLPVFRQEDGIVTSIALGASAAWSINCSDAEVGDLRVSRGILSEIYL